MFRIKVAEYNNAVFPKGFLIANPFLFRKIVTDPHILAHVNIEFPETNPKFKIYIVGLILDRH